MFVYQVYTGKVAGALYRSYFGAMGGCCFAMPLFLIVVLGQIMLSGSNFWLGIVDDLLVLFCL
jgi:hypothetical protein